MVQPPDRWRESFNRMVLEVNPVIPNGPTSKSNRLGFHHSRGENIQEEVPVLWSSCTESTHNKGFRKCVFVGLNCTIQSMMV